MQTVFIPVEDAPIPATGRYTLVNACAIDGAAVPVAKTKFEPGLKQFAASGRVQCSGGTGSISVLKWGIYEIDLPQSARRLVDYSVTRFVALKLDNSGRVAEAWLADRPTREITQLERIAKTAELAAAGKLTFSKSATRSPEENKVLAATDLESALRKAYSEPQSVRDGFFRKDVAVTQMPTSHRNAGEYRPEARTQREDVPPRITSDPAIAMARVRQELVAVGEFLQAEMKQRPTREVGDAGLTLHAFGLIGLGVDRAFLGGTGSVAVSPNNEALAEAWAHSTGDKMAAAQIHFRKALTATRALPMTIKKVAGEIVSGSVFSKSAAESAADDVTADARRVLRESAIHTARAHLKALDDKLQLAVQAHGGSPHLSAAGAALRRARQHLEDCMETNPDKA